MAEIRRAQDTPGLVATVGSIQAKPGAINVIAGETTPAIFPLRTNTAAGRVPSGVAIRCETKAWVLSIAVDKICRLQAERIVPSGLFQSFRVREVALRTKAVNGPAMKDFAYFAAPLILAF